VMEVVCGVFLCVQAGGPLLGDKHAGATSMRGMHLYAAEQRVGGHSAGAWRAWPLAGWLQGPQLVQLSRGVVV
jgi:hypothetical protein